MKFAFAILALASLVAAADEFMTFEQYVTEFNKEYTPAEYSIRKAIFGARIAEIRLHNARPLAFKRGINHFTDRTEAEMSTMLGFNHRQHHAAVQQRRATQPKVPRRVPTAQLPESVDWTTQEGVLTPVKNQGGCGSCWAFASTEAIESCAFLTSGKLPVLAPQQLVDCANNSANCGGTGGCEGATQELAFQYAMLWGMTTESEYPYTQKDGVCQAQSVNRSVSVAGFVDIDKNSMEALMAAVAKQPVTVSVAASDWFSYSEGVFTFDQCGNDINHAVLLVGYGTDPKHGDYWKVQNSWGPSWGEKGFIRLQRDNNDDNKCQEDTTPLHGSGCPGGPTSITVCGTCGILSGASYPTTCQVN